MIETLASLHPAMIPHIEEKLTNHYQKVYTALKARVFATEWVNARGPDASYVVEEWVATGAAKVLYKL